MSIAKLNGLPKGTNYSAETVDRVKDLLNAGEIDVNDVSQYFSVPKALIIQSLTDISPDVYTSGSLTAPQVERVQDLIKKGVTSTGDVSEYFNVPTEIVERNLTQELGYNPSQIAEAQSGAPVSAAPAPVAEAQPTPTPTPAAIPSGTMYTADRFPGIDTPAATPAAIPSGVNDFDALAGRGYNLAPVATTQYQTGSEIPTGLRGSEMALKGGATGAIDMLDMLNRTSRQELSNQYGLGLQQAGARAADASGFIQPYQQAGETALQQQMALSGALGQEAFDQAYQESPQMAFLREQGMRANLAGAGATGGLGGGNIQKELQRFGQGLASQGLQQQIGNLSGLSSMGQNAAGTMANIQTGLGSQQLQGQQTLGNQLAAQNARYGLPAAQTLGVLGTNLAAGRTRAGEQLATQYGGAAANLADIYSNQGGNIAGMLGGQRNMLMDQYNSAALNEARAQQGYGADMSNIQQGIASGISGTPQAQINTPDYQGGVQNALNAGALGYGIVQNANNNQQQNTFTPTNPNQTFTAAQTTGFSNFLNPTQAATNIAAAPMANPYMFNPAAQAATNLNR
tara:strand:- start:1941 stop:3650 length:1710 start_codon:yes stop_codon:yes gene_type:complete